MLRFLRLFKPRYWAVRYKTIPKRETYKSKHNQLAAEMGRTIKWSDS